VHRHWGKTESIISRIAERDNAAPGSKNARFAQAPASVFSIYMAVFYYLDKDRNKKTGWLLPTC
jgi:hypothetical protein